MSRAAAPPVATADFSGEWQMDLDKSEPLGPVLRSLGLNRVLAALVSRVSVSQSITQDNAFVRVAVSTKLSTSQLNLRLDGAMTPLPGLTGDDCDATSGWSDDGQKLETRQKLTPTSAADLSDEAFVTVRSLQSNGGELWEEVTVVRGGSPTASARRVLRRK